MSFRETRAPLDSAVLFTPGRASYVTTRPDGSFALNLTAASVARGRKASMVFDPAFHTVAAYAGGYPAIAGWPEEHVPPLGNREADRMAAPLERKLADQGWSDHAIARRVLKEGESTSSLGDVAISMQRGLLRIDDFHDEQARRGIDLVAGYLHGMRFFDILSKGLDMDPTRIHLVRAHDRYGCPATEFESRKFAPVEMAREAAGILLTRHVLKDVTPGDPESLLEAEQRLNSMIARQK